MTGLQIKNLLFNVFVLFSVFSCLGNLFRDGFADKNLPSDVFVLFL